MEKISASLLLLFVLVSRSVAQDDLASLFTKMKSSDENTRYAAQLSAPTVLKSLLPHIRDQVPAIRAGLQDQDPYIRLQATGILQFLSAFKKGHDDVVLSCLPDLLNVARDPVKRVRNNAISAVANLSSGVPEQATPTFLQTIHNDDSETRSLSAAALLRAQKMTSQIHDAVLQEIKAADTSDKKTEIVNNVLIASAIPDDLADAVSQYTNDADPNLQLRVVMALPRLYTNKRLARTRLQNLLADDQLSALAKTQAAYEADNLK